MSEVSEQIVIAITALDSAADAFDPHAATPEEASALRATVVKGELNRKVQSLARDAERALILSGAVEPKPAGLTQKGFEAVQEAFVNLPEETYLELKANAEAEEKALTLSAIRKANPEAPPPPPKGESEKELMQRELNRLKAENDRLSRRVATLETQIGTSAEESD